MRHFMTNYLEKNQWYFIIILTWNTKSCQKHV